MRASYQIHNGQKRFRPFIDKKGAGFVYGDRLQTLGWITEGAQMKRKHPWRPEIPLTVVGPVKPDLANPRWVPLTSEANYTYYLDMDPAPGGDVGQVILYIHDEVKAVRVNRSFHQRLLHLAVRLRLGMYVYSDSMGRLVTVKDRADEMEAKGIKTAEEEAEYRRLRGIQAQTTLHQHDSR